MTSTVAFVGAGPTTIYTLKALFDHASDPFAVTIFEEQPSVGRGTPYRPGWNDPAMLSNIASVEIPPIEESLFNWLSRQGDERLEDLGIDPATIDARAFYPRVALGAFFKDQFEALIARARATDITVTLRPNCKVVDAVSTEAGMILHVEPRAAPPFTERFDHVVLATGHQWPAEPEVRPGYFLSPWPATALAKIPPAKIGIRGSSLTAIDATVALAVTHGTFEDTRTGLRYAPAADTEDFHMTMVSRKGLLPEADFYFPIPYEPLAICTEEAIEQLLSNGADDLLNAAFHLFKSELALADPDYARRIDLDAVTLEDFHDRYFADRIAADPFLWAESNLAEARKNYEQHHIVPWRYAILRMHEVIEQLVPHFDERDFKRFSRYFKPIFVDDYATVPHESIERMLALHHAGKLDVIAVGAQYRIDSHGPESGAVLHHGEDSVHFPYFIEATGQRALSSKHFPFPSLCKQGIIRDVAASEDAPSRGIAIDDEFHPVSNEIPENQLFCLSLPFLLGRHPFIQGITSSHEMGLIVGEKLAAAIAQDSDEAATRQERTL